MAMFKCRFQNSKSCTQHFRPTKSITNMRQTPPLRPYGTLFFLLVVFISTNRYPQQTPSPPGELIDIGGQRIHLNCPGSGSPTVLLESGTGGMSVIWSRVQPGVSKFTKVCS